MQQASVICVLGMSRSGTSLTAKLLNLTGVYLGPSEELLDENLSQLSGEDEKVRAKVARANPGGHWEHYRLMRLNERILELLGGSWRDPPPMPPGWESSAKVTALREEALEIIGESFGGKPLWGWKDPRNSLTLPFWQALLPRMRYVICVRDPAEVAASLQRRDGIAPGDGVRQWIRYLAAALVNTAGRPRLLVRYEDYFEDPTAAVSRLARFIGREEALDGPAARRVLTEVIDKRLRRSRACAVDSTGSRRLLLQARSLLRVVELLAMTGDGGGDGRAAHLNIAADLYGEGLSKRLAPVLPAAP